MALARTTIRWRFWMVRRPRIRAIIRRIIGIFFRRYLGWGVLSRGIDEGVCTAPAISVEGEAMPGRRQFLRSVAGTTPAALLRGRLFAAHPAGAPSLDGPRLPAWDPGLL